MTTSFCFLDEASAIGPRRTPNQYWLRTSIVVSATEVLIPNKVVLTAEDFEQNASLTTDGALRYVPGFSLFRRTGSRTANPTTQGASLRGVGASGAGRTLVLFDGIPLNDPFGGWVYWNRMPVATLKSIEVYRGGTSDVFGADALSGTIHFQKAELSSKYTAFDAVGGNQQTSLVAFVRDQTLGNGFLLRGAGQYFHSEGDFLIQPEHRAEVDRPAGSEHTSAEIQLQKQMETARLFIANSFYSESRNNGTMLQINDTELWQLSAGGEFFDPAAGEFWFRVYGGGQSYNQTFSAVAAGRHSEILTREQHVPSQHFGGTLQWNKPLGDSHWLYSGFAVREVSGETRERVTATNGFVFQGGRERTTGWFLQDRIRVSEKFALTLGSRFDLWEKLDGHSRTLVPIGETLNQHFRDSSEWQWSPRIVGEWAISSSTRLVSTAYRSFRPPTLNELYRGFRVGNVLTLANEELIPERLVGVEMGVRFEKEVYTANCNLFWNRVQDPVTNFTVEISPELITRKRINLGSTNTRGIEFDWALRSPLGQIGVAYQYSHSEFDEAGDPSIEGNRIPQVPAHSGSFFYSRSLPAKFEFEFRARAASRAYDDDRNKLILPGYWLADLFVSKELSRSLKLVVGVENLFDHEVIVSRTPIPTIGTSTLLTAGVRLRM